MLLGKRTRPPMKRTTSLSEITFDLGETVAAASNNQHADNLINPINVAAWPKQASVGGGVAAAGGVNGVDQRLLSMVSPRNNHRRYSADFLETAHFLRACGLCKRRLVPGRDIYMYRGDSAFCSLECRQQQMNQDERKDKCSYTTAKKQAAASSATTESQVSTNGTETVAAV